MLDQSQRRALDIDPASYPDLPEGVWGSGPGVYMATCRKCRCDYELCYDPQDFTDEGNYCSGSDRCLP